MSGPFLTVVHKPKLTQIIAILVGIVLSVPVLYFIYYFIQNNYSQASNTMPRDVVISELKATKAKITWTTDQEVQAVVEYGTSPNALVFYAPESKKTKDHAVELDLLTPRTTHYFQIRIGEEVYDNGGAPWTFTTKSTGTQEQPTLSVARPTQLVPSFPTGLPTVSLAPTATPSLSCGETDCRKVQQRFGKGCSVSDYIKCINSQVTPTSTPSGTLAPTATSTPVPRADLIIDTSASPNICLLSTSPSYQIRVDLYVKNQGTATSGEHKLLVDLDPTASSAWNEATTNIDTDLNPNASIKVYESLTFQSSCTQCKVGSKVKVTVDSNTDVNESNENNNTFEQNSLALCSS